jgi:hypothetical protein
MPPLKDELKDLYAGTVSVSMEVRTTLTMSIITDAIGT